jgi:hypothetical protein
MSIEISWSHELGWDSHISMTRKEAILKDIAFPLNISLTVAKNAGDWRIAANAFFDAGGGYRPGELGNIIISEDCL